MKAGWDEATARATRCPLTTRLTTFHLSLRCSLRSSQVTLSFPSNPGKILKSAETQFDEVVNIAELKVSPPTPATPSSSSSSKSLPNGRRLSSAGLSSSSPAPAAWRSSRPRPEPSARQPPMTKAEMRKVQKRFDSALDEMAEILSTGAHLDSMNNAPKRFTDSVDPDAVSIKQKTIRQILLNVRQIPSSDSDSPEMSSPPSDVLDRIVSVFHNELMVPQNKESRIISPRGRYVKTLRDILLQDGKKWRVFSGEAERGAKDGRSEATIVVCIALSITNNPSSARSSQRCLSPSALPTTTTYPWRTFPMTCRGLVGTSGSLTDRTRLMMRTPQPRERTPIPSTRFLTPPSPLLIPFTYSYPRISTRWTF